MDYKHWSHLNVMFVMIWFNNIYLFIFCKDFILGGIAMNPEPIPGMLGLTQAGIVCHWVPHTHKFCVETEGSRENPHRHEKNLRNSALTVTQISANIFVPSVLSVTQCLKT